MADSRIGDTNYYLVYGWMMNQLGLKGVALQVYAIIYGFSQDGKSEYTGSIQYLCDFCGGVSKPTIIKALKELTEQKYIIRREETVNNVTFVRYKVSLPIVKNLYWGGKETLPGEERNFTGGGKETLPNKEIHKEDYKEDYKKNNEEPPAPPAAPEAKVIYFGPTLQAAFEEWLKYKKERREAYKETGLRNLVSEIKNNAVKYGEDAVADLIRLCMASNWRGIIFDRLREQRAAGTGVTFAQMRGDRR